MQQTYSLLESQGIKMIMCVTAYFFFPPVSFQGFQHPQDEKMWLQFCLVLPFGKV